MEASDADLRHKMEDVLKAIGRNENVDILYRGRWKAVLVPSEEARHVHEHPFFGMKRDDGVSVEEAMDRLRGASCRR